jgi:NAD(P)H-flavin reductase
MSFQTQQSESVPTFKCSILSITLLTHKLYNIIISKPKNFTYQAGQYIKLYLDDDTFRLYSIANAPNPHYLELHIQEPNHDNYLKEFLLTLKLNQTLFISDSMGKLVCPPTVTHPILLIAAGYAFAPLKAILENLYMKRDVNFPVYLYWGLSTILDIYHQKELQKIKNDANWFNYQIILSHYDDQWSGKTGNLADFIFRDFDNLEDYNMYVCGSKDIVKDIYDQALQNNLTHSHFYCDYNLDH